MGSKFKINQIIMTKIKTRLDAAREDLNYLLGIRDYFSYERALTELRESVRNFIYALDAQKQQDLRDKSDSVSNVETKIDMKNKCVDVNDIEDEKETVKDINVPTSKYLQDITDRLDKLENKLNKLCQ